MPQQKSAMTKEKTRTTHRMRKKNHLVIAERGQRHKNDKEHNFKQIGINFDESQAHG